MLHSFVPVAILVIFLPLLSSPAFAQAYTFQTFSQNEGLSSYNPGKIVQDKFGFLWITTQEGINRFDGRAVTTVKKHPGQTFSLSENFVEDCEMDANGNLWIGTSNGGIDVISPEKMSIVNRFNSRSNSKSRLVSNWVRALCWVTPDELWVGTYYGISIYQKSGNSFHNITFNPFQTGTPFNVSYIGTDAANKIWVSIENQGVLVFDQASKKVVQSFRKNEFQIDPDHPFKVYNIYQRNKDSLFLCTSSGLYLFGSEKSDYSRLPLPSNLVHNLNNKEVRCMAEGQDRRVWIGTNTGLYVMNASWENIQSVQKQSGKYGSLLDNDIKNMFADSFGNLWIISKKGINRLERREYLFTAFGRDVAMNTDLEHVNTLYPFTDSTLFVCSAAGFFTTNIKSGHIRKILPINLFGFIREVAKIDSAGYLLSGEKELVYVKVKNSHFNIRAAAEVYPELRKIRHNYFNAIRCIGDSLVLFGSEDETGLYIWHRQKRQVLHLMRKENDKQGIYQDHILNIRQDRKGNIWILHDECLSLFHPDTYRFEHFFPEPHKKGGLNSNFLFDLYDDGKFLWLTSYGGGLNRFDKRSKTFLAITEKEGLTANTTYCVLPENDSLLWVSSNNGLSRVNTKTGRVDPYYFSDGLHSSSFDVKAACQINSALFFGGVDGFTKIQKSSSFPLVPPFPVYITKVEFYEKEEFKTIQGVNLDRLVFKPGVNYISFDVAALGFVHSNKYRYEYKVKGISNDWINIKNSNTITLAGLPPGAYQLKVRVQQNGGNWNEARNLAFTLQPFWYQTLVFKLIIFSAVLGLIYAFYRYRITQLQKQHRIRKDIASDLHDDLGGTLNAVKILTHMVQMEKDKERYFAQIEDFLQEAITGLRDLIWVLDSSEDTLYELVERIKKSVVPVAKAKNVDIYFDTHLDERHVKISKTEKRNLLLIIKESVNNSIKHSGCQLIRVSLVTSQNKLLLSVQDDGYGFDMSQLTDGHGLKNISKRASQMNSKLQIISAPEEGTKILIEKSG